MRLDPERSLVLVVDVQTKLFPHIADHEALAVELPRLVRGAAALDVPVMVTEQYVKGLGPTIPEVAEALGDTARPMEKSAFSCVDDEEIRDAIAAHDRQQIVVSGIETHVCVYQTAIDLITHGYHVYLVTDAVGSRRTTNRELAVRRLEQAGVLLTSVEMALFEWCRTSGTERFKAVSRLVK